MLFAKVLIVHVVILVVAIFVAYLLYSYTGKLTGEESLFLAGILSSGFICYVYSSKWPNGALFVCFCSTLITSTVFAILSYWTADMFETFLIFISFYIICLVGVGGSYIAIMKKG